MSTKLSKTPPIADKDALAKLLELDIIFGRLFPNQRLIEDDLMDRFDRSRHHVRRAIDTLVLGGLAMRQPNKGAHVCSYSSDEIRQMYELRIILQTAALERISFPIDSSVIKTLKELHELQIFETLEGNLHEVFHLNNQLRSAMFECCGSPVLCECIEVQARRTHPIGSFNLHSADYMVTVHQVHAQMIEAMEQGDLDTLIVLNRTHILDPMKAYFKRYGFAEQS